MGCNLGRKIIEENICSLEKEGRGTMEELEAVKLDILEAGRKHGLREISLQSIAKLLEKGKSKEEFCNSCKEF